MNDYQLKLKGKLKQYCHLIYKLTKKFPKSELFISVSQLRKAALSSLLNYVEGYARNRIAVRLNFLEISYGSFQESKTVVEFSVDEGLIDSNDSLLTDIYSLEKEIGAMLWKEIENIEKFSDRKN